MTDGSIGKNGNNCTLTSKDDEWLINIRDLICPNKSLSVGNSQRTVKSLVIHSPKLNAWFQSYGCKPAKSLTITMPNIPSEYIKDFLRGCFDGDGCLGINAQKSGRNKKLNFNVYCELASGSSSFIKEISVILTNLGFKNKTKIRKINSKVPQLFNGRIIQQKNDLHLLRLSGNSAHKLISFLYYEGHQLSIDRKRNRANFIIQNGFKTPHMKLEDTEKIIQQYSLINY